MEALSLPIGNISLAEKSSLPVEAVNGFKNEWTD